MTHDAMLLFACWSIGCITLGLLVGGILDHKDESEETKRLRDALAELETQNRILSETLDRVEERQRLEQWHLMRH